MFYWFIRISVSLTPCCQLMFLGSNTEVKTFWLFVCIMTCVMFPHVSKQQIQAGETKLRKPKLIPWLCPEAYFMLFLQTHDNFIMSSMMIFQFFVGFQIIVWVLFRDTWDFKLFNNIKSLFLKRQSFSSQRLTGSFFHYIGRNGFPSRQHCKRDRRSCPLHFSSDCHGK